MKHAARTIPFLAFILALWFQPVATAQQETPFQVGSFGAIPDPLKTIRPPRDIASLLPRVALVRVLQNTRLAPGGETTVVYDIYERTEDDAGKITEKNAHVVIVRDGKIASDLGAPDEGCDLAGFAEFRLEGKSDAAAIAFRCGGDGSHTDFFLLRFDGQSYALDSVAQTFAGRIEILETDPAEIRVWSAEDRAPMAPARGAWETDDTCVWCEQHYSTDVYVWENGQFEPKSHEVTPGTYQPGDLNQHPIVKSACCRNRRPENSEPGSRDLFQFPQDAVKFTAAGRKKTQKKCECNLTESWILLYCVEVGGALIRREVY